MNVPPLAAVALADQVERLGSYFGFAAVIGLGVLSMLYFAQAREVKRLREWAGRSPERDAELAQRRAAAPSTVQPSPQTPAAQQADAARKAAAAVAAEKAAASPVVGPPGQLDRPAAAPSAAAAPGALAGAAPAPGSVAAAKAVAAGAPGAGAPAPPGPGGAPASAGTPAAAPASAGTPAAAPASAGGTGGPGAAPADLATPGAAAVGPGSVAGASGGAATGGTEQAGNATASSSPRPATPAAAARQAGPPSRTPTFANGAGGQDTHESPAARPEPPGDRLPRAPRAVTPAAARMTDDDAPRRRAPGLGTILAGTGALAVVAVVLVVLLAGGSEAPPADNEIGSSTPPPAASESSASTSVDRKATQVAVLNGTTQTGLARSVGNKLEGSGFTILSVGDNADQQIASTTISYADGGERAARVVARIMDVSSSAVKPIDLNTSAAVDPAAKVVVVVGLDRSSTG